MAGAAQAVGLDEMLTAVQFGGYRRGVLVLAGMMTQLADATELILIAY